MGRSETRGSSSSSSSAAHVYSSIAFVVRAKSALNWRRNNQVASMENAHEQELQELELFQSHVADRLSALDACRPLFSIAFLQKLLDAFVSIEEEFRVLILLLLSRNRRDEEEGILQDYLSAALKSLDVCNAVTQALDSLDFCYKQAEIAASALAVAPAAVAQRRRARRALSKLDLLLRSERNSSFGRNSSNGSSGFRRGISLNVYKNWSAAKQVQAMAAAAARAGESSAIAAAVQTMTAVSAFTMWALVAAFSAPAAMVAAPPRQAVWAAEMVALQERAAEELKRDKKGMAAPGMLAELQVMAKCCVASAEIEEGSEELAGELVAACRVMEEGIGPLRRRVREVFHRVVLSRAEIIDCLRHLSEGA